MYLVVLILFGINFVLGGDLGGINKTVGWAYDISNQIFYNSILLCFSQYIFLIGYLLITILGRYTDVKLSIIHFGLILGSISMFRFEDFIISTIFCLLSILMFFINISKTGKND